MCKQYNGWSNYPTWCANLHLTNVYNIYKTITAKAKQITEKAKEYSEDFSTAEPKYILARWIKQEFFEDYEIEDLMLRDLLDFSIGLIDFSEIAEGFLAE